MKRFRPKACPVIVSSSVVPAKPGDWTTAGAKPWIDLLLCGRSVPAGRKICDACRSRAKLKARKR